MLFSLALMGIAGNLFCQEKELESRIQGATVFYQGAQINRTTNEITLPANQSVLVIKGLEQSLVENSLRIGVKGKAKILNVVTSTDYLEQQTGTARIEELQKKFKDNKDKTEELNLKIQVYEQEKSMLVTNMKLGGVNTGVTVAQIKEGVTFYRTRLTEIEKTILDTRREIREIEEENRKIQSQLSEWNYKKNMPSSRIEVSLEMEKAGDCSLLLDYIVSNASWRPSYDIRIDEVGDPVKIFRKSTVRQNTGTDWKNIKLSFSTGNPMEQQELPELYPWYIDFIYPQQTKLQLKGAAPAQSQRPREKASLAVRAAQAPEAEALDEYDFYEAVVDVASSSNNSIQEFALQTPASISADGKEYVFAIGADEIEASYHYQSVPKKEKAAYMVATMTDWEGYELVDGKANIYYEQMFIGETYLSTSMTLDSLQLSVGKDKGLVVDRKVVKEFTKTRNIGANVRKGFGYELIVRNTKAVEVNLIVEDQIPVSSNSQISVEKEDIGDGKLDPVSGKVTWRIKVAPGETVTLPLRYSVKYPKDSKIGL